MVPPIIKADLPSLLVLAHGGLANGEAALQPAAFAALQTYPGVGKWSHLYKKLFLSPSINLLFLFHFLFFILIYWFFIIFLLFSFSFVYDYFFNYWQNIHWQLLLWMNFFINWFNILISRPREFDMSALDDESDRVNVCIFSYHLHLGVFLANFFFFFKLNFSSNLPHDRLLV